MPRPAADMQRLFFALWPDPATAKALASEAARIAAQVKGRAMRADSLHVTLAFLGNVASSAKSELMAACDTLDLSRWPDGISVRLDRLDYWRHNGIVAATSSGREDSTRQLAALLGDLSRSCAIDLPVRPFVPHLTLVRSSHAPLPSTWQASAPWELRAQSFRLVSSQLGPSGSRYQSLGEWGLSRLVPGPSARG